MSSIKAFGFVGTGGLGVLVVGLLASKTMDLGLDGIFSSLLFKGQDFGTPLRI